MVVQNRDQTLAAMRRRWHTEVELGLGIPTQYGNLPFVSPTPDLWARFDQSEGLTFQAECAGGGQATIRLVGVSQALIVQPLGRGTAAAFDLADQIDARFRAINLDGIEILPPTVQPSRRFGDDWRTPVTWVWTVDFIE